MNTKQLTKLVAFVVTFALSVTVAGFFKPYPTAQAQKITALLVEDISNGTDRKTNNETFDEFVSKTGQYVAASENIDYSGLPADFTDAWLKHMQAWRAHSDSLDKFQTENGFKMNFSESGEITGEIYSRHSYDSESLRKFRADYNRQSDKINQTWYRVLLIAKKYGAEIPANALD